MLNYLIQHGPEGTSFLCPRNHYNYVDCPSVESIVQCPECDATGEARHGRMVTCASPDHNEPGGCSNEGCWKHSGFSISGLSVD